MNGKRHGCLIGACCLCLIHPDRTCMRKFAPLWTGRDLLEIDLSRQGVSIRLAPSNQGHLNLSRRTGNLRFVLLSLIHPLLPSLCCGPRPLQRSHRSWNHQLTAPELVDLAPADPAAELPWNLRGGHRHRMSCS